MRTVTIIVSAIAFAIAVAIAIFYKPGPEAYLGVAVTLAALLGSFFLIKEKPKEPTQRQEVKEGSYGVQAGRDITGGNFEQKEK